MGRPVRGSWMGAAAALMAVCFAAPASAQQAPLVSPAPVGPSTGGAPQSEPAPPSAEELPISIERVREGLERPPALDLDVPLPAVFHIEITERIPLYWEFPNQFHIPWEPRTSTTRWHDEYLSMTTSPEFRAYSPMLTQTETAVIAATSLAFAGALALMRHAASEIAEARRNAREAAARQEVEAALRAFLDAQQKPAVSTAPPD